jgi:lipopolysaccharide transport system permease protein
MLAVQDLKLSYRRSTLGPFWLTISSAVQIATIGIVFSTIFKSDISVYVPYLATSLLIFTFITGFLNESNMSFIQAEGIIRQMHFDPSMYIGRTLIRNILGFAHNLVILPVVFLVLGMPWSLGMLMAIPGFLLVLVNLWWLGHLFALISLRFRDFPPIFGSIITVAFYSTPVMWGSDQVPGGESNLLISANPFFHLLSIVRSPLLGEMASDASWFFSATMATIGTAVVFVLYRRYQHKIAFWI